MNLSQSHLYEKWRYDFYKREIKFFWEEINLQCLYLQHSSFKHLSRKAEGMAQ